MIRVEPTVEGELVLGQRGIILILSGFKHKELHTLPKNRLSNKIVHATRQITP